MKTFIFTLCTSMLLALSWSAAAQPAPGAIPRTEKGPERAIHSIPLPLMPGETPHTTYCPMKIGKIPHRDNPVEVDYSRKPRAGSLVTDDPVAEEKRVIIVNSYQDASASPTPSVSNAPPPPPPPPRIICSDLFRVVEEMPRFPCQECEALPTRWEKKQCSDKKLLEFLYQNLTYPALARENCVAGTVVIKFYIEKDGAVTNAKIVRDIGSHCGEAALDVVNLMNERGLKWIPGRQRGRTVRVQIHIPVKFRIECPDTPPAPTPAGQEASKKQADEALHPSEATPSGTPLTLEPEGFRLFPNPATDWLNVRCQPTAGPVSFSIINAFGQVFWKQEYEQPDGVLEEQADLTQWPPGAYFLRIEQRGEIQTYPFVRQR